MGSDLAPRERLLRHGAQGLSDAELLAVVLRTGSPGIPALRTAERLLGAAGGLDGLFAGDREALRSFGISGSRASILLATAELLRGRLAHVNVVGGCCGTDHRHIEQVCAARFGNSPVAGGAFPQSNP